MAQSHEKVGVQVEAIARQCSFFGGAAAANVGVSFDDRDFQACPRQVGRKREPVVSRSNNDSIESRHSLLPGSSGIRLSPNDKPYSIRSESVLGTHLAACSICQRIASVDDARL